MYKKEVPIRLLHSGRSPQTERIVVEIKDGRSSNGPATTSSPCVCVQLTSENDPFFLYAAEFSDSDFQLLKSEQRLLVDFQSFPQRLADLLDECIRVEGEKETGQTEKETAASEAAGPSSLFAGALTAVFGPASEVLSPQEPSFSSGETVLSVIEITRFSEITHLALRLRPGNDHSVKVYLAAKLQEFRGRAGSLEKSVQRLEAEESRLRVELRERSGQLKESGASGARQLEEAVERHRTEIDRQASRHREALEALRVQSSEERRSLEAELRSRLQDQSRALEEGRVQKEDLRARLVRAETAERETLNRLQRAEAELADARLAAAEAQSSVCAAKSKETETERLLTKTEEERRVLMESGEEKERILREYAEKETEWLNEKKEMETEREGLKKDILTLEERLEAALSEVSKGVTIVQKLQAQVKHAKQKLHTAAGALEAQRKEGGALLKDLKSAQEEAEGLRELNVSLQKRSGEQTDEAAELRRQICEARQMISSNKQLIEFLNKRLAAAATGHQTSYPTALLSHTSPPCGAPTLSAAAHSPISPTGSNAHAGTLALLPPAPAAAPATGAQRSLSLQQAHYGQASRDAILKQLRAREGAAVPFRLGGIPFSLSGTTRDTSSEAPKRETSRLVGRSRLGAEAGVDWGREERTPFSLSGATQDTTLSSAEREDPQPPPVPTATPEKEKENVYEQKSGGAVNHHGPQTQNLQKGVSAASSPLDASRNVCRSLGGRGKGPAVRSTAPHPHSHSSVPFHQN
uniref:Spindle assembly abnormal protein 6 N-terminal domain-containing protein n=1 Tax=Chromera velia CCMP2878 TaxID=1169474 RepID=A0A0G4IEW7_9ALVE|eukprot:Cvel_2413.t1-p1 / transcript=Cvel_2413.t1 / gene=Cvel_2413 / organism=Chromera_velia_CCMP2878 / gene_product=Spindle assembly abnormal protein 6 homolog, putative / transcript_product=Spindle assembly abnormal protein 6 homolog, putative / location=Cvel_scaffold94:53412-56090(-) / protein_length=754 / sequence_SO=supercontig / SO=protein_coding / is_pseudo=false